MTIKTLFRVATCAAMAAVVTNCGNRERIFEVERQPLSLMGTASSPTSVALDWDVPVGADVSGGVRVFRDGHYVGIALHQGWTDQGLTPLTLYTYHVAGVDADGVESPLSNAVSLTTLRQGFILSVAPGQAGLEVGAALRLTAVVRDSLTNVPASGHAVAWSSTNASVATVSADGMVNAIAPGAVTITAAAAGKTAHAAITVVSPRAMSVTVTPVFSEIDVLTSVQLVATARDGNNQVIQGKQFTWSSNNVTHASVSNSGLVTGLAQGPAVITATTDDVGGTAVVVVASPNTGTGTQVATSIEVVPGTMSMSPGSSAQLTALVRDQHSNIMSGQTVSWSSGAASVASVSSSGMVSAHNAGSVVITAAASGLSATASVAVVAPPPPPPPPPPTPVASVGVTPPNATIGAGGATQLTATPLSAGGTPLLDRPVTWSSSDPNVAQVSQTGVVTAVGPGTVTITATSEGKTGTAVITVTAAPPEPVFSVTVSPPSVSMAINGTALLTATPKDAQGNPLAGRVVTWSSSNTGVATVAPNGTVTGVSAGVVIITATSEGKSGTASAEVTAAPPPAPVASITVTPPSVSIVVGATANITATPKDAQGNPLVGRVVTWSSNNPSIASVNASGVITGVATGNTTVTATSEGISADVSVTVTPKPVVSVIVSAGSGSVCVGASLQLSATPLDIDGNPLTGRVVVWSVDTGLLASINPSGLLLGLSIGTVTVTATVEGVSASLVLSICPPIVATVEINAPSLLLSLLGLPMQLGAVAKDANGNVITGLPVTWSVTPPARALILGGLVTPLLLGNITVTATIGGVSASIQISIGL